MVSSSERPSTTITSVTQLGIRSNTWGRLAASFSAGITALTVVLTGAGRPGGALDESTRMLRCLIYAS
jgi:hypothetical protein